MMHLHDAIRDDWRLALDLRIAKDPDYWRTEIIGELFIGKGMIGWVNDGVVGPGYYSGSPLHIRHGRFENIDGGPPWRFHVREKGNSHVATIYPVRGSTITNPEAYAWDEWRRRSGQSRECVRSHYVELINETMNVNFSAEI